MDPLERLADAVFVLRHHVLNRKGRNLPPCGRRYPAEHKWWSGSDCEGCADCPRTPEHGCHVNGGVLPCRDLGYIPQTVDPPA